jgi:heme oxygenase
LNELAVEAPALLSRLRAETRDQHDAIEQALLLMDDDLSIATYRHRLEQFYGFYKPVEDRLLRPGSPLANWLSLEPRRKAALLEADLETLGRAIDAQFPLCSDLPPLNDPADYFGCLYVLEGASLGGVVISRQVQPKLGVTALSGGRFFNGYGQRTGAMWQEFRTAITAFSAGTDQQDAVVAAARATFATLNSWCTGKPGD